MLVCLAGQYHIVLLDSTIAPFVILLLYVRHGLCLSLLAIAQFVFCVFSGTVILVNESCFFLCLCCSERFFGKRISEHLFVLFIDLCVLTDSQWYSLNKHAIQQYVYLLVKHLLFNIFLSILTFNVSWSG